MQISPRGGSAVGLYPISVAACRAAACSLSKLCSCDLHLQLTVGWCAAVQRDTLLPAASARLQQAIIDMSLWCGRTWKRNSVAGSGGPTVPACRLGGGCVKNEAAHLHNHWASLLTHLIASLLCL
jgi:hypothetical protein